MIKDEWSYSHTFIQHLESYNAPNTVSRFLRNDKADV